MLTPARWTALVVEPDRNRSALLFDLLRELGCAETTIVRDGESAMAHLAARTPRIVLVAARMPGEDGFQFTHRLRRATGVRSNDVSTVLTFSAVGQNDIAAALNAGADAILAFPLSRNQLGQMLHLLDTQKRAFVRAASYVGPCRRRGLVGSDSGRRLEDYGVPVELDGMMAALRALFEEAQRGQATPEAVDTTAMALAVFMRAARPDRQIDGAALSSQCRALVKQFTDHAPGTKSFDHAFAPLRKLLTGVVLRDAKKAPESAAA
jgi:CheY-like chemotaxis protein